VGSEARTRVGLIGLLIVTLFSFSQVFDRGEWPGPALLGMAVSMLIVIGARRSGIGTFWTVMVSVVALLWYLALVFRMKELFFGLPGPAALEGLWRAVDVAMAKSNLDYAPVPVRTGYVILTVAGMWVMTALADIATFRWRRPLFAALPAILTFSFLTIVGTRRGTTFLVLVFLGALLSYLALESSHRLRSWGTWVASLADRRRESPSDVSSRLARRMGASCLAAALFAPVFLPALGDGLLSWRNPTGSGPGSGAGVGGGEVDLLASLQTTLIRQSQADMFEVVADRAEYWRLTSLVAFDGTTWRPLQGNPEPLVGSDGQVASNYSPIEADSVRQRVEISGLEGEHLPAAVQAGRLEIVADEDLRGGLDLRYEPETGSVELSTGLSEGLGYEVQSFVPSPTFKELRDTPIGDAPDLYTSPGPVPISPEVQDLLDSWTAGARTPFARLVALQDALRLYTYSVDVQPSASTDLLTAFLTETGEGYCQQFAAAFALLARHMGYPARVSIGFLPGDTDLAEPNRFRVKGTDAHAWPEVLFEDYGWVRFEPTPGNGAAPPLYTREFEPFTAQNPLSDIGGIRPGAGNPGGIAGNQEVPTGGRDRGGPAPVPTARAGERAAWEEAFSRVLTALLLGVLVAIASIPLLKSLRTSIRYRTASHPAAVAAAAFSHFEREAADLATGRARSESATGFARRLGAAHRAPKGPALELASIYERAEYARDGIDDATAAEARRLATDLRHELWTAAPLMRKLKRLFSPSGLVAR
jgi:transglutaminase-like putative cysteine protease